MNDDTLRSAEVIDRYLRDADPHFFDTLGGRGTPVGTKWMVVENEFPYDKIATQHDLLYPVRRFATLGEMDQEEARELADLTAKLGETYDSVLFNFPHAQSIPGYFHLHLLKFKYRVPPKRT